MNTNLKVSNISKIYPGCIANDNISLEFESGKIYALLGENGAGKSTLVKILSGVIIADQGDIFLNKKILKLNSPLDAKKNDIGMVFQHFNLFETHMLITTSLSDNRVLFDEPAKFTAKLREYKTDNNLLLLKTEMNAGHGGKSGRDGAIEEIAIDYAFALKISEKI